MNTRNLCHGALALTAFVWAPAALAQSDTASAGGEATIVDETVLERLQDLDFGRMIPSGSGGLVSVNAATGAVTSSGGVTTVSPSAHRAFFRGRVPDDTVMVVAVDPTVLLTRVSGSEQMIANLTYAMIEGANTELFFGLPIGFRTTDTEQLIAVGGSLTVSGTQTPGIYSGTFNLSVAFP